MTDAQASQLIGVVKATLLPKIKGHPEQDDLIGEAILAAYERVERLAGTKRLSWTTIAGRAALWGAWEYLRQKRSGLVKRERPLSLEELDFTELDRKLSDDGGIPAAEARALLAFGPGLTKKQWAVLHCLYWQGLSLPQAAEALGICHQMVSQHRDAALTRYRVTLGIEPSKEPPRCRQCRQMLTDPNPRRRFCSVRCKSRHQDCRRPPRSVRQVLGRETIP